MKHTKGEFIRIIIISIIILISIIFILGCSVENGKVLVFKNTTTGKKTEFYLPNNRFSLGYIHSVMKTPAEEFFHVNINNKIVLEKTIYESFGVGLPFSAKQEDFELVDDKFILYINREYNLINMIISPIPEHWLQIEDKKYELMDFLIQPDCSVTIFVHDKNIVKRFFNFSLDFLVNGY